MRNIGINLDFILNQKLIMITQIKTSRSFLCVLTAMILFSSCKKDKPTAEIPVIILPPSPVQENKTYLPERLSTGNSSILFSYSATFALTEINYGNGDKVTLQYDKNEYPYRLRRYINNEPTFLADYFLDKNGLIITAEMFTIRKNVEFAAGYYTLKYDTNKQPVTISYYDNNDKLLQEQKNIFNSSGSLISETNGSNLLASYDYDIKNGLFKNVKYAWLFALEKENPLLLSSINNIKDYTDRPKPGNSRSFIYAYNQDNYPKTINTTVSGVVSTTQVIYKK